MESEQLWLPHVNPEPMTETERMLRDALRLCADLAQAYAELLWSVE